MVSRVETGKFNITRGRDSLHAYAPTPEKTRFYCRTCCSPIYVIATAQPEFVRIRLGVLDFDPPVEIAGHMWVSEKPDWHIIHDTLPQHPGWPDEP